MKRITFILFLICSFLINNQSLVSAQLGDKELKELAVSIENQLKASGLKKTAILDFSNPKKDLFNLDNYLKDTLFNILSESKYLEIMLNHKVNQLLQEQNLGKDSLSIGDGQLILDILNVDAIVTGILTDFPDKIKINTRLIGTKGKLLAVYSNEIQKTNENKVILERIVKGEAYEEATSETGKIFFSESFRTFKPNTEPAEWGNGFIIGQDEQGNNFITSNIIGERDLVKRIYFPDNFTFSFNFSAIGRDNKLEGTVIFADENSEQFLIKFRASGAGDYVLLPSTQKITAYFSTGKLNNFRLEKKRDIYKLFINNEKLVSGIYTQFKRFKKIIIRVDFSQGKFTDFQGVDLGR